MNLTGQYVSGCKCEKEINRNNNESCKMKVNDCDEEDSEDMHEGSRITICFIPSLFFGGGGSENQNNFLAGEYSENVISHARENDANCHNKLKLRGTNIYCWCFPMFLF